MSFEDLIYVDENRLNWYVEKLGPPITHDTSLATTIEFSWTPKVVIERQVEARGLSTHEKIQRLREALTKADELGQGRLTSNSNQREDLTLHRAVKFREETCKVAQIAIPPAGAVELVPKPTSEELEAEFYEISGMSPVTDLRHRQEERARFLRVKEKERRRQIDEAQKKVADFEGLKMWVSHRSLVEPKSVEPTDMSNPLFLLADFGKSDAPKTGFGKSAYSALSTLLMVLGSDIDRTVLHTLDQHSLDNAGSSLHRDFIVDPIHALCTLGAVVECHRTIKTIYRIREKVIFKDQNGGQQLLATIAYPIIVQS